MSNNRWLYTVALLLTAPIVISLWLAAIDTFVSGDVTVVWRSGGKLPPSASSSLDIFLATAIATAVWGAGLHKYWLLHVMRRRRHDVKP